MNRKLLLIQPSPYGPGGKPVKKSRLHFVGLALPLLAALTPEEWQVSICLETIEDIPYDTDADLVGISTMGHGIMRSFDIAREFRARGKTVILGGYMASLMPEEAGRHCDAVVIGDAERVWRTVLEDAARGALKPFYHERLEVLRTPVPRYELLAEKRIGAWLPVQAGRGCPHTCSFCSVHCLYRGTYLQRPLDEVLRDIRRVRELGYRRFLLLDDNIHASPAYLRALCRDIETLGMQWMSQCAITIGRDPDLLACLAASGCTTLSFGLESISAESLESMDKAWADPGEYADLMAAIRRAGIAVSTEMVVGADGDTPASIRETARFIEANGIVLPRFYILTPIPGTDFFKQMQAEGRLCHEHIETYDGTRAVHHAKRMDADALTTAYWDLYDRIYSLRSIFRRTLLNRHAWRTPLRLALYLSANFYYRHHIRQRIPPNIF
jgi:radical SAM superfamily enzyme YgiQ (UPF0313 family)